MGNAPPNTYSSLGNLSLGHLPPSEIEDPAVWQELYDIHNAIESLVTYTDPVTTVAPFVNKFRDTAKVTSDYTVLVTNSTVEVDASLGDITITLPLIADGVGYRYDIKRVDIVPANKVTLIGNIAAAELIDDHALGIYISPKSCYTVKSNNTEDGWNII